MNVKRKFSFHLFNFRLSYYSKIYQTTRNHINCGKLKCIINNFKETVPHPQLTSILPPLLHFPFTIFPFSTSPFPHSKTAHHLSPLSLPIPPRQPLQPSPTPATQLLVRNIYYTVERVKRESWEPKASRNRIVDNKPRRGCEGRGGGWRGAGPPHKLNFWFYENYNGQSHTFIHDFGML